MRFLRKKRGLKHSYTTIVFEHWFNYTTPLNFTRFKGIIKAFSGMCVWLTTITFPLIWSSVLISVA